MSIFHGTVGTYSSKIDSAYGPDDQLLEVSQTMKERNFRHMPIVQDNEFVGLITDRDLKLIAGMQRLDELCTKDIMKKDLYVVNASTSLCEVLGEMIEKRLDCALVKENNELYIFTATDAMKVLKSIME